VETQGSAQRLPSDDELVALLRERNESALALLVDAWSGGILRLARFFVSTDESAAEVMREAWISVVTGISAFDGRSSLKTWVYSVLVHAAKRRRAEEGRATLFGGGATAEGGPMVDSAHFLGPGDPDAGDWWISPTPWPAPTAEQVPFAREIRQVLPAALDLLPDQQRIVITLRDVEGHSADEVCEILDISAADQRVLLHRARAFVRDKVEDYFASHGGGTVER
jgi:RNA polymerase sigma-70 factor, ECF subfamily